jgi:hypothetical protein
MYQVGKRRGLRYPAVQDATKPGKLFVKFTKDESQEELTALDRLAPRPTDVAEENTESEAEEPMNGTEE